MIRFFARITVVGLCLASPFGSAAQAASYAYITHSGGGGTPYIAVIDTDTHAVVGQVPTPYTAAFGIALDPAGSRAYAAGGPGIYYVIDTATNSVVATPVAGYDTKGVAIDPAGHRLYVTSKDRLQIFDTATNQVVKSFNDFGQDLNGVVVNRAGSRIYVVAQQSHVLTVIDAAVLGVVARVTLGSGKGPIGLALDPVHDLLYIANAYDGSVTVVDTTHNAVVRSVGVGAGINGVAANAAGTRLYAADGGGQVVVLDTATYAVVARIPVGGSPVGIDCSDAGGFCYVVDLAGDRVVVVDTATNTVQKSIAVGRQPIAFGRFIGPTRAPAVEYFHAAFGYYFVTASADEIGKLDAGAFAGWARTGESFKVSSTRTAGTLDVCRFFTDRFPPSSSHFYTPFADECAIVKANADWSYEGLVFAVAVPDGAAACRLGTNPLYRYYNNGKGGAPNHRYTTSTAIGAAMSSQGWTLEGVVACVPK
jgi:YVTN family beta-propeller protein